MESTSVFNVGFINIRGQTGLNLSKQVQIEQFINQNQLDVLNMQESNIDEDTFS